MFGINIFLGLLKNPSDIEEAQRFKILTTALDACVRDDRRDELKEQLDDLNKQIWWDAGWKVFGQLVGNTLTLGLGFLVHTFV